MSEELYPWMAEVAAAPSDPKEKNRVLSRLKQIAKRYGVPFNPARVKWTYYDLWKREGPDMFAEPWHMRYPIDRAHIRAAITYFNRPSNRQQVPPKARLIILERILRKALSYGIEVTYQKDDPLYQKLPESLKRRMKGYKQAQSDWEALYGEGF